MTTPNVNPSPRTQFQQSGAYVAIHQEMITGEDFIRGISTALLEYQWQLCVRTGDANGAAASHFRMTGALEFVDVLKRLAEPQTQIVPKPNFDNLSHAR